MIFATGDTHTDWMSRLNSDAFPEGRSGWHFRKR